MDRVHCLKTRPDPEREVGGAKQTLITSIITIIIFNNYLSVGKKGSRRAIPNSSHPLIRFPMVENPGTSDVPS